MSTENEGTAGEGTERPATQSVPPGPDAAPEGTSAPGTTPTAEGPGATSPAAPDSAPAPSGSTFPVGPPAAAPAAPAPGPEAQDRPPYGAPPAPDQAAHHHAAPSHGAHASHPAHAASGGTPPPPSGPPAGGWPPPPPPQYPAYGAPGGAGGQGYGDGYGDGYGGGSDGPGGPAWGAPDQKPPGRGGRIKGGLIAAVIVGALVAGGIGGGIGYWAASSDDNGGIGSTTVSAADLPKGKAAASGSVAGVAASSLPSVVTIDATSGNGSGDTGTGFVFDKQGHILTNNHVVAEAASGGSLSATFSNGKKYKAEVVGRAEGYDVAVIKLTKAPSGLRPLPLGNSDQVQVGDSTIAIGAPFGLSNTVTTGIISAEHRPVVSGDESGNSTSYMSALQTDASINPGNSGGPLLDARGAVIGINSAIQPGGSGGGGGGLGGGSGSQPGSVGLGFAIPINQASTVAQQLIKTGQPVYPIIGATVTMTDAQQGDQGGNGAVIAAQGVDGTQAVTPNGPADKAGLRSGDVITKFGNTPVDSGPTLISEIWTHKPNDKVSLTYQRDGQSHTVQVTLGARKGDSNS